MLHFSRSRGIELTKAGLEYVKFFEEVVEKFNLLNKNFMVLSSDSIGKTISIASSLGILSKELMPHIEEYYFLEPNINFNLIVAPNEASLYETYADIVIWGQSTKLNNRNDLVYEKFKKYEFGLYCSKDYIKKYGSPEEKGAFRRLVRFDSASQNPFSDVSNELFKDLQFEKAPIWITVDSHALVYDAVTKGLAIGAVGTQVAEVKNNASLVRVYNDRKSVAQSYIITKKDLEPYHHVQKFKKFIMEKR